MTVDVKKQRIQLTMKVGTYDGGVKKEVLKKEAPKKENPKKEQKKNYDHKNNKKDYKKNDKKPIKKGNNFFDGIVIQ